jgi:AcrR family transcriptional regulator
MSRTSKVVEDRREQILDAAMRVFAEKGFSRATNRDVAREAGITAGLIYYYFDNKEALLQAVLEAHSPAQILAQVTPEMLEQPPEVFLPLLVQRVLNIAENEPFLGLVRVVMPEALHNPEMAALASGVVQRVFGFLGGYLQMQVDRGTLRADLNLDTATHALIGSVVTLVIRRQILCDPQVMGYTHEELARSVVDTVLQGIQPQ